MCRRQAFEAKAKEENTIWRTNLQEIRLEAHELTHVLMPQSMLCEGDQIQASTSWGLVLAPISNIVEGNCAMKSNQ